MSEPSEAGYRISYSGAVLKKMKALAFKASHLKKELRKEFLHALKTVYHRLETDPLGWGEVKFRLTHSKWPMFLGLYSVLAVHYTVLEDQRVVIIKDIEPVPSFPLENGPDENA